MLSNRILKVVLLLLGGSFVILQGFAFEVEAAAVSSVMLILLTVLYCRWTENKTKYFFWFLVTFTLSHTLSCASYFFIEIRDGQIDYVYYIANLLYMLAYIFLIIKIIVGLDLKAVFSELLIPIIVLIILDIFCVYIVSGTTEDVLEVSYSLEFLYNTVVMALLSVALINYMYRNDNKSMLFLIGSICIVFSEIIQLAYYYILLDDTTLGFTYSFFLVIAFLFLYLQSQVEFTGPVPEYNDEQIEA